MIAVIAVEVLRAIPRIDADGWQGHHDVEGTEGAVLVEILEDAADGHRFPWSWHEVERPTHDIATQLLAERAADEALTRHGHGRLPVAYQNPCAENVEEAGVGKDAISETVALSIRSLVSTRRWSHPLSS